MRLLVLYSLILSCICSAAIAGDVGGGEFSVSIQKYRDLDRRLTLRAATGEAKATIPGTNILAHRLDTEIRTVDEDKLVVAKGHERPQDVKAMVNLRKKVDQLKAM
ncbi:hypothetical protein [Pseudobacteriovorax antillogorgiicola]|uniref:Uncharacterized protein n=1 Tax=Pseudobacteriovorax antillogorgiicola TaxID=1513793 RepID=A0A1Y6CV73_9BACT|nr:hypothetical protein [Pseudobacteriovorax antillogorgiicola]TCS44217.1 hypothetical protein EDD56_13417 [Pseudobacteriovorax antillogorgiicola]SMF80477.1 hypothetical protein SAMN06296036_13518 [Pseudobacteriovorax antillogorgiicola]